MMKFFIYRIMTIFLFLGIALRADVPAPDVDMPENIRSALSRIAESVDESNLARMVQHTKSSKAVRAQTAPRGPLQVVVPLLLGNYSNASNTYTNQDFQNQIFDDNPGGTMIDYYREISYGQFELSGGAFGWYRLPQTQSFYVGGNSGLDGGGARFARDLAIAADDEVDYSQYDADDDGYVDVIMVVHTGAGAETGVSSNIWSHRWSLNSAASYNPGLLPQGEYVTNDPWPGHPGQFIRINDYIIQPELARSTGGLIDIGVFCHEFGHALGLPDLYDTDYSSSGIGRWGLMAGGSYGGDGSHSDSPTHMCAWSKEFLGWIEPTVVEMESLSVDILNAEQNKDQFYKVYVDGEEGPEYFLFENRQKIGFDRYLSGNGLLIWHIDQDVIDATRRSNTVNNNENKKGVDLEEADGRADLDSGRSSGDAGDPFPGAAYNTLFNSSSNPNSADNEGVDSGVALQIDRHQDGIISVSFLLTPELAVNPVERIVAYDAGQVLFKIRNNGGGVMSWRASVIDSWLSIVGADNGRNLGELVVAFEENTAPEERTGFLTVEADGAEPVQLSVTQTAAGEWVLGLNVADKGGENTTITFGQRFGATDALDSALGEVALDATPPTGVFDARFELADGAAATLNDFRAPGSGWMQWRMIFQAGAGGYPIELSWDSNQLPAGSFLIQDEFTGTLITVDMKLTNNYVVPTSSIKSLKITYSDVSPQTVSMTDGWNLLSVPFLMTDASAKAIFPESASSAFYFEDGYKTADVLMPGRAYWVKFQQQRDYTFLGTVVSPAEIELKEGWNMIGPFDQRVETAAISTQPSGIIESEFFDFNGTYDSADFLVPGRGYWIKASEDGTLILSSDAVAKRASRSTAEMAKLVFTDASHRSKTLFVAEEAVDGFFLPPLPPGDAWDVRFENDCNVVTAGGQESIFIRGAHYPVSVRIFSSGNIKLALQDEITPSGPIALQQGKAVQLSSASVYSLASEAAPKAFVLEQNYPNPFNPTTTINFSLPNQERTVLTIYNARGQFVETVVDKILDAGNHSVQVNAENYASGLYIYNLQAGQFQKSQKMIVLR